MKLSLSLFLLFLGTGALAHPVSYKGATGFMSYNNPVMNEMLLTYSFNFNYAAAMSYIREKQSEFYIPRVDFLLHRWNNEDSQGNLYVSAGSGIEKFSSAHYNVRLAEVVADWESRKYYAYFEQLHMLRDNPDNPLWSQRDDNHRKFRLGFAPFLADYSDLNVWLIAQVEQHNNETAEAAQVVRFYMKNVLWEIGAGFNGNYVINFMVHL